MIVYDEIHFRGIKLCSLIFSCSTCIHFCLLWTTLHTITSYHHFRTIRLPQDPQHQTSSFLHNSSHSKRIPRWPFIGLDYIFLPRTCLKLDSMTDRKWEGTIMISKQFSFKSFFEIGFAGEGLASLLGCKIGSLYAKLLLWMWLGSLSWQFGNCFDQIGHWGLKKLNLSIGGQDFSFKSCQTTYLLSLICWSLWLVCKIYWRATSLWFNLIIMFCYFLCIMSYRENFGQRKKA